MRSVQYMLISKYDIIQVPSTSYDRSACAASGSPGSPDTHRSLHACYAVGHDVI